jgi:hypothetical protein
MTELQQPEADRVLVPGGQGVFGKVLAAVFAAAGWTTLRAGRRPDAGVGFRHVGLEPETLEKVPGEADVIVNTVPGEHLAAERISAVSGRPRRRPLSAMVAGPGARRTRVYRVARLQVIGGGYSEVL